MPATTKQFRKAIRQLEDIIGPLHAPIGTAAQSPEVFVAVFGRRDTGQPVEVLGGASLAASAVPSPHFVIADADTASALRAGATPTQVGFAWVSGGSGAGSTGHGGRSVAAAAQIGRAITTPARVQAQPVRRTQAPQASGTTHTDARTVSGFGHRPGNTPDDLEVWAIELSSPTIAPLPPSSLPAGASPASGWCVIFPFLSMCKTH